MKLNSSRSSENSIHLASLHIYPVKALRGLPVPSAPIDELGAVGDRRFLVTDETGQFLTQRTHPRMALIETGLDASVLTLRAPEAGQFQVPRAADPKAPQLRVRVWKSEGLLAEDCGGDAAEWLSRFLGVACRLARIGPAFVRPVLKKAGQPGDVLAFADSCPFMAISEASLADLNDCMAAQGSDSLPMDRFRPNLVLSGGPPYVEDRWTRIRIGNITFRAAGNCARCIVTTTDQKTGERTGPEPLRTLATYRRNADDPTSVDFGQNFIHETKTGTLNVGDPVEILA